MKQKLSERNTYTSLDASLVQCNCDLVLNKEETLSVLDLKTPDNSPEVNQAQQTERSLKTFVFALNCGEKTPTTRVGVFSHDFYKKEI